MNFIKVTHQVSDMKRIYETFEDEEFQKLEKVKDDRSWREAILEEFGVA